MCRGHGHPCRATTRKCDNKNLRFLKNHQKSLIIRLQCGQSSNVLAPWAKLDPKRSNIDHHRSNWSGGTVAPGLDPKAPTSSGWQRKTSRRARNLGQKWVQKSRESLGRLGRLGRLGAGWCSRVRGVRF